MLAPPQQLRSEATSLVAHLPPGLPEIGAWERSSGLAEFEGPQRRIEYELYVDPARGASYSITRYRILVRDPEERRRAEVTDSEKLQWDVDGRLLRRYDCRPGPRPGAPCVWVELALDSPEYRREFKAVLAIYAIHHQLLKQREAGHQPD